MPSASPLITITPAAARSEDSCSATASPYGDGLREPTTATRGPAAGGQRPRERRPPTSGRCIVKPVAKGLEHVPVVDALCAVEVGGCARDTPRAMKAPRRQALLVSPPFERPARARLQRRSRTQRTRGNPGQRASERPPVRRPPSSAGLREAGAAAERTRHRDAVVRGPEWPHPIHRPARGQLAQQAANLSDLQSFAELERRHDA